LDVKAGDVKAGDGKAGAMIDGIIFDKDGTLFDFRKSWGAWAARLLADLTPDAALQRRLAAAIGYLPDTRGFAANSPVIADTPYEIAGIMAPHLPAMTPHGIEARMNALAAGAPMTPAVPLRPLLTALRARGLRLGLATNDAEAPARAHMEQAGITDLMDKIMGCDSGYGGKPAPGMLLAFAHHTGIAPARIAMVGDSRHDLIAGRAAGMRAVAVLTGVAEAAELSPHADVVLPDISHLPDWLDEVGTGDRGQAVPA
jgi:phosphoglycolate phosphatase